MLNPSIGGELVHGEWSINPWIVLPLGATALAYLIGWTRLARRSRWSAGWQLRSWCFVTGFVVLVLALLSPLHELGESLLSAHMIQHELLMVVAAPLLVAGRPLPLLLWGLPPRWRRSLVWIDRPPVKDAWRWLTGLGVACVIHAAAILVWHLPRLYQASVESGPVHALQHLSFIGTALLFWWAMLEGAAARRARGTAMVYLTLTSVYTGGLGMLLTFARSPIYPLYLERTGRWGITPLDDQRLAGLIMWIPGGLGYLLATLVVAALWLGSSDRRRAVPLTSPLTSAL